MDWKDGGVGYHGCGCVYPCYNVFVNWLVPVLFAGPVINFWQTLGLLVLSKILFSGFGKGRSHDHGRWRGNWKEKWSGMTPEERERFKQKMKNKWCYPSQSPLSQEQSGANG